MALSLEFLSKGYAHAVVEEVHCCLLTLDALYFMKLNLKDTSLNQFFSRNPVVLFKFCNSDRKW